MISNKTRVKSERLMISKINIRANPSDCCDLSRSVTTTALMMAIVLRSATDQANIRRNFNAYYDDMRSQEEHAMTLINLYLDSVGSTCPEIARNPLAVLATSSSILISNRVVKLPCQFREWQL